MSFEKKQKHVTSTTTTTTTTTTIESIKKNSTSNNKKPNSTIFGFSPMFFLKIQKDLFPTEEKISKISQELKEWIKVIRAFFILAICCNTLFVGIAYVLIPFLLWEVSLASLFLVLSLSLYSLTYKGDPASNGRRKSSFFIDSGIISDISNWFYGTVVTKHKLDNTQQYIFAFAPHGVMPLTAVWMFHHETWKNSFQGIDVVPLGSSVFHYAPLVRDIAMWSGTRQASRSTFSKTIKEGKSVMIIPGGISEMKHSKSKAKTITLDAKHKGFVKMAFEHGKDIVPIYSFGETKPFDLLNVPFVSKALLKYMKMPFPYFLGVGGIFQLPRREKITAVVGKPIKVSLCENPSQDEINRVHREYYSQLLALFEENKKDYGHHDSHLEIINLDQ